MNRKIALILVGLCGIGGIGPCAALRVPEAYAESSSPQEYAVKAAFLYNFAKFIEWPPEVAQDMKDTFVIGIFGNDPFGGDIDELLINKTVNERKIEIKRFRSLNEIGSCHILFITSPEVKKLSDIMRHLKGKSVLTVSEANEFAENGGMINFVTEDNKVRFEINKQATDKVGLKLSSQLLKLAKVVI